MSQELLISMIEQFGYAALFFALWLGIVGMPIPDEVIVMTGGMVTALGILHPVPAFALTYLGVVSGLSLGYVLGRKVGAPVLERFSRKEKTRKMLGKSQQLVERYGSYALCLSYFLPVVRHLVPYLVGMNQMSFRRYAVFSYSTGFVWTMIFFVAGYYVGDSIEEISAMVTKYGWYLLLVVATFSAGYWLVHKTRARSMMR